MRAGGYLDLADMQGWDPRYDVWKLLDIEDYTPRNHPATRSEYHTTKIPKNIDHDAMEIDGDPKAEDVDETYDDLIHPVFRRAQWDNMTDEKWQITEPVVQLATRVLEEPAILPFFNGIINNIRPLNDKRAADRCGDLVKLQHCNSVSFTGENAQDEMIKLWKTLASFADCITWCYAGLEDDDYANTEKIERADGPGPFGLVSLARASSSRPPYLTRSS